MLDAVLDVFRMRQYFDVLTRTRELGAGVVDDLGLLDDLRRALVRLPTDRTDPHPPVFRPERPFAGGIDRSQRLALIATGGSGALASMVGAAKALEDADVRPSVISSCSGSALFGFPLAAGLGADEVARFTIGLEPQDYLDLDWSKLAGLVPTLGRGFAGLLRGDAIEETYHRLLGDMTLADLPIPGYAPIWNIEENRLEYIGPRTHPNLTVARAVRLAIALPLFIRPVEHAGYHWCDGGIVDIFPVHPVLDIEPPCDVALAVNGFYPPAFAGEEAFGWEDRPASILYVASQVRTSQQIELARANLVRLREASDVVMIEPVSYEEVRGIGFYRQFLTTRDWPRFMQAGRQETRQALMARARRTRATVPALVPDAPSPAGTTPPRGDRHG
ncbi:MAG: patatin-like phospholipase family protein [Acidimicrobiales bacterium]